MAAPEHQTNHHQRLKVLVVDDDSIARKVIEKALTDEDYDLRFAENGEKGLELAFEDTPDLIVLDVEMPDLSGYEVCVQLRNDPRTVDTPVIFLSSHSSLRARMQGYEVGGNDYLLKPFEQPDLIAKINVLAKYSESKRSLKQQYDIAQQTAFTAMTATSELGEVMNFVEKSYELHTFEELALSLFSVTDRLHINCALLVISNDESLWFSADGVVSPLEQELIEMSDRSSRFVDFGARTIVHFSYVSILARNMPLDDPERYGRVKDLLPVLLTVVNAKANTLTAEQAVIEQSVQLKQSITQMKNRFYYFAKGLVDNNESSEKILRDMIQELTFDFLKLGLEEEQEEYVVARIEDAIDDALEKTDTSESLYHMLKLVLSNINNIVEQQESLVETFDKLRTKLDIEKEATEDDGGIELF